MGLFKKDKYKQIDDLPLPQIQPIQTNYPKQQIPVQTQQVNQARIVSIEESVDGEFTYKVVTNYQLNLGDCQLI